MPLRALLIDDDQRLRSLLTDYLSQNDVLVDGAPDGKVGLQMLVTGSYDAVVLDVMMPGQDGLTVLRKLRETSAVPVIMLTAKGDETDRVVGLELGADDYLSKPFSPRELLARMRAVLRRGRGGEIQARLHVGDLEIDRDTRQVRVAGDAVDLTGLEFDLLLALCARKGRIISRAALWELAGRSDTIVSDRAIDVHISHLRKKLGDHERSQKLIQTVRGVGYVFGGED
jgi:two-component system, OmpR family, response regulator